jgi:hypothetical protein
MRVPGSMGLAAGVEGYVGRILLVQEYEVVWNNACLPRN